ncbi:hypothetical protein BCR34DRAFT_552635 [Clohesyomyces aquaticus]|uniref:CFEM domain-containing protein n=1 Tax=Clohesyomyces aquaticus TaxID=1231657 RepID=A0A1Y2A9F2_9PLEO|nr:hypothetical protein BCR34DRAFT_552635 [Clohesyomyces aquaticus]
MRPPSIFTILAFVTFALEEVKAQTPSEQIRKLPVCAQTCITKGFAQCKCNILNFACACNCDSFVSFCNNCTDTSCADSYLKPVLEALDRTCKSFTKTSTIKTTSPVTSSTFSISTTIPTTGLSEPLTNSILTQPPTGTAENTGVFAPGASSVFVNPGNPGNENPTGGTVETGITGYPPTTGGGGSLTLNPTAKGSATGAGPFPFFPATTTASWSTYAYCYPAPNGTARGLNATISCVQASEYTGAQFTGGNAMGKTPSQSWIVSIAIFLAGLFFCNL